MKKFVLFLGFFLLPLHTLFASDIETDKLQWHLGRVEGILRQVDTSTLTEDQKANRTNMLDRLHSYTEAGQFPNNDKFPGEAVPFFRGSNGNLCAVGYLMDADPEYKSFIENTVKTNNNVRIMDAQSNPTLNAWANKYGFSLLELAMIQPTYSCEMLSGKIEGGKCITRNELFARKLHRVELLISVAFYGILSLLTVLSIFLFLYLKKHDYGRVINYILLFLSITIFLLILGLFIYRNEIIQKVFENVTVERY